MKIAVVIFALALVAMPFSCACGQQGGVDYKSYSRVLKANVRDGLVNYRAINDNMDYLNAYLQSLTSLHVREYESWSREERIAFWINAYNAITIFGIIKNYPIEPGGFFARRRFPHNSIRQIGDFWDTPFVDVMGAEITLNQIEHDTLRAKFGDPRIHFSIVCASIGCPLISGEIYRGDALDNQLENDAWRFINNGDKVRVNREKNRIYVSSIFDWYKKDFPDTEGSDQKGFMEFILRYIDPDTRDFIIKSRPKVKFLDYDWTLNELEGRSR